MVPQHVAFGSGFLSPYVRNVVWDAYSRMHVVPFTPEFWREAVEAGEKWKRAVASAEIVNRNLQGNARRVTAANAREFAL